MQTELPLDSLHQHYVILVSKQLDTKALANLRLVSKKVKALFDQGWQFPLKARFSINTDIQEGRVYSTYSILHRWTKTRDYRVWYGWDREFNIAAYGDWTAQVGALIQSDNKGVVKSSWIEGEGVIGYVTRYGSNKITVVRTEGDLEFNVEEDISDSSFVKTTHECNRIVIQALKKTPYGQPWACRHITLDLKSQLASISDGGATNHRACPITIEGSCFSYQNTDGNSWSHKGGKLYFDPDKAIDLQASCHNDSAAVTAWPLLGPVQNEHPQSQITAVDIQNGMCYFKDQKTLLIWCNKVAYSEVYSVKVLYKEGSTTNWYFDSPKTQLKFHNVSYNALFPLQWSKTDSGFCLIQQSGGNEDDWEAALYKMTSAEEQPSLKGIVKLSLPQLEEALPTESSNLVACYPEQVDNISYYFNIVLGKSFILNGIESRQKQNRIYLPEMASVQPL